MGCNSWQRTIYELPSFEVGTTQTYDRVFCPEILNSDPNRKTGVKTIDSSEIIGMYCESLNAVLTPF